MNIEDPGSPRYDPDSPIYDPEIPIHDPFHRTFSDDDISNFVNMIHSMHKCVQAEGVSEIWEALFGNNSSIIPKLVEAGVVPKLLEFIAQENDIDLLTECLSCIANMSSEESSFVEYFIELGGPDIIFKHLDSSSHDLLLEVLRTFCSIVSSGVNGRDLCLKKDLVTKLLEILERFPTRTIITETVFFIIKELTRGEPFPDWEKISLLLPVLHKYIAESSESILERALWSLCHISDEKIQEVIDQGCVPLLIKHLFGPEKVAGIALATLGQLLLGTTDQIMEILMFDEFLPKLFEFTQSSKTSHQAEAFWIISSLTGKSPIEIDLILKNDDYMAKIKNGVATASPEVAAEAAWAICNMIVQGNKNQVNLAVRHHKILEIFPSILMLPKQSKLKHEAFQAILVLLVTVEDKRHQIYLKDIEESNLIEIIKSLAEEDEFRRKAKIVLSFFEDDQIEDDQIEDDQIEEVQ